MYLIFKYHKLAGFSFFMTRLLWWPQILLRFNLSCSANKNTVIVFSVLNTLEVVSLSFLGFSLCALSLKTIPSVPLPTSYSPSLPIQLLSPLTNTSAHRCQWEPLVQPTHVLDGETQALGIREISDRDWNPLALLHLPEGRSVILICSREYREWRIWSKKEIEGIWENIKEAGVAGAQGTRRWVARAKSRRVSKNHEKPSNVGSWWAYGIYRLVKGYQQGSGMASLKISKDPYDCLEETVWREQETQNRRTVRSYCSWPGESWWRQLVGKRSRWM